MRWSPATFTTIIGTTGPMNNFSFNVYGYSADNQVSMALVRLLLTYGLVYNSVLYFGICYPLIGNCLMLKGSRDDRQ